MSEPGRTVVVMPRLGESIVEATLARWRVAPGDRVQRGQVLAEVETDKATNEIPSPRDGVVAALACAEGQTVEVGATILELSGGEVATDRPRPTPAAPPPPASTGAPSPERLPSQRLGPVPVDARGGPLRTSPAVRRLARLHRLDLATLTGSGKGGRVTRDDVLRAVEGGTRPPAADLGSPFAARDPVPAAPRAPQPAPQPAARAGYNPPPPRPQQGDRVVPFSRRRQQIAERMVHSQRVAAHVFTVAEIDMKAVLDALAQDAAHAAAAGVKLTFLSYVVAAIARALVEHPELNAVVGDDALVLRSERNVGVAVDTPEGLVVPVIHRADELGLVGLARRIEVMSARARSGQLAPDDLAGGTFTLSNPGREGNLYGASIIRQPEVAILRIGTLVKRPVVRELGGEDVVVVRPMMYACLSYDHRVIDGRLGNAFLHRIAHLLTHARPALSG
jgi:pyruvate/2-oxoglutarate dehydrogenase complex dihydrolipoamide acyltransferase (E2) component